MIRVPTVNHIPAEACSFLASGIEPSRGTRGEVSKPSCPAHSTRQARPGRPLSFGGNQSSMRRRASLRRASSSGAPPVVTSVPTRGYSAVYGASPRIQSPSWRARPNHPSFPARALKTQLVLIYIRPSAPRTEHLLNALRVKPCGLRSLRSLRAGDLVGLAYARSTARAHRNSPLDPPSGSRLAVALRAPLYLSQPLASSLK